MRRPAPSSIARSARNTVLAGVALLLGSAACGHDWSTADTAGGDADAVTDGPADRPAEDAPPVEGDGPAGDDASMDDGAGDDGLADDVGPVDTAACDPAGGLRCEGNELQQCTTDGWVLLESCRFGCLADELRCRVFDPLNLEPAELLGTGGDLTIPPDASLVYDTGECGVLSSAEARIVGTDTDRRYCVVTAGRVQVEGQLRLLGAHPLILVARGTVTISGTIDLSAVGVEPGAGGGQGGALDGAAGLGSGAGGGGRHYGTYHDGGGGGGAGGGFGGTGGAAGPRLNAAGGTAGIPFGSDTPGEPLVGGGGGGAGGALGAGGAGGGALQVVARTGILIEGRILAGGGGGGGGRTDPPTNWGAGGGGGGGGTIVLEAPTVQLRDGVLAANGGGGGGGTGTGSANCSVEPVAGTAGADGSPTAVGAGGGDAAEPCGGAGGAGAGQLDTAGLPGATADDNGGGGGGGPGLIVVRTADGSFDAPGIVSPVGPGLLVVQPLVPEP